ncbi:hypothetical protein [uncultured Muribaculum sp.]|uniref:hypothetical protein n=1 Tax=uncultured Muribaculum sp. TaxID=1918613 RepID=UPI00266FC705|nr:hypothetical protein [uncultured Muribaculum sp.]
MKIIKQYKNVSAQFCAKHLRLKSRIIEKAHKNQTENYPSATILYLVKVQVKIMGVWVTVWAETCDHSDGDTRQYIKNRAAEVHEALTTNI